MSGPLLFKAKSNILVLIFTQQTVFTTSHVVSTSIQCGIFQDNSCQLNPPNDEKVEDQRKDEAFESVCEFLEENNEEQLTISGLVTKMGEYVRGSKSMVYGDQYLKEKLLSQYGNSIFLTEGHSGVKNIVTFREKT